jgi:hypothetical protein
VKRLTLALICAAGALATPASVLALQSSESIVGKYRTTIKSNAFHGELKGKWTIKFTRTALVAMRHGKRQGTDKYSVRRHRVTFKPSGSCPKSGTYSYTLTPTHLTFTRVKDSCTARRTLLASVLTRVT